MIMSNSNSITISHWH